jgi:hypothetical protein
MVCRRPWSSRWRPCWETLPGPAPKYASPPPNRTVRTSQPRSAILGGSRLRRGTRPPARERLRGRRRSNQSTGCVPRTDGVAGTNPPSRQSGGGWASTIYWLCDCSIKRDAWIEHARKLKALTGAYPLLSRTRLGRGRDIASLLRHPWDSKPQIQRPDRARSSFWRKAERETCLIETRFLTALDEAHGSAQHLPTEPAIGFCRGSTAPTRPAILGQHGGQYGPAGTSPSSASALRWLDPFDCDEATLGSWLGLAPLAAGKHARIRPCQIN